MQKPSTLLFLVLSIVASASAAACGGGTSNEGGSGGGGGTGGSGGNSQSGVPCDVAAVMADKCLSCHGAKPSGAPMSLATYEDLTATSTVDSTKTVIERAVIRMADASKPMPPAGGATADDIAVLQAWIDAGTPKGDCTEVVDPFGVPVGCESGKEWNPQAEEGPPMNPGEACINCHKTSNEADAPIFLVAGTVYPWGHESKYCYGIDGTDPNFADVHVEVTDANGVVFNLSVGQTGNFYLEEAESFVTPYTAKVVSSKGERAMTASQTDGDCNGCHTQDGGGNGSMAPGRIVIPF
ncbi:MAG: hypothetical protein IPK82_00835 [Polyangiaceae bacterium]|nr:hypothetical protein [Polyangiaceae bacterium]